MFKRVYFSTAWIPMVGALIVGGLWFESGLDRFLLFLISCGPAAYGWILMHFK